MNSFQLPVRAIPIEIAGIRFNDSAAPYHLTIEKWEGWWDSPDMSADVVPYPSGHGGFLDEGWNDARMLSVEGKAFADSPEQATAIQQMLSGLLSRGERGRFTVDDPWAPVMYCTVRRVGRVRVDWYMPGMLRWQATLVAPDPRKYGQPVISSTGVPKDGGGLQYDLYAGEAIEGVLDYGLAGSPGTVVFTNQGTADTAALLRLDGYAPGAIITELNTGNRLVYSGTVPTGSYVLLDPQNGSVLLDGYADRSAELTVREWTRTPEGAASIFRLESAGPNARLTVEGASAWF